MIVSDRSRKVDKRTRARELAMQGLYQLDIQGDEFINFLGGFIIENESDPLVQNMAREWTTGTWENVKVCDRLIESSTLKWGLSRLSFVDKSILRLAVYQLKYCRDIPARVVINEAIELAKKFSTEQSPKFVNGVLDAVLRKIKAEDQS